MCECVCVCVCVCVWVCVCVCDILKILSNFHKIIIIQKIINGEVFTRDITFKKIINTKVANIVMKYEKQND